MTQPNLQQSQSEGDILAIRVYRYGRRCVLCKKLLSIYNPGPPCNICTDAWYQIEIDMLQTKRDQQIKRAQDKANVKRKGKGS